MSKKQPDGKENAASLLRCHGNERENISRETGNYKNCGIIGQRCCTKVYAFYNIYNKDNMADHVEEQENYDFSDPTASSKDSDTEFVIYREVLDASSTPDDEMNADLAEKFDQGFENWNTFDVEGDSHIESVELEDGATIGENTKSVKHENMERADTAVMSDYEEIAPKGARLKPLELHSDKSPEIEFRHRYLQQQQQQQQHERLTPRDEESKPLQSNNQSSKTMEPKTKSYNKDAEFPSITEADSEEKLHDGVTSKSTLSYSFQEGVRDTSGRHVFQQFSYAFDQNQVKVDDN